MTQRIEPRISPKWALSDVGQDMEGAWAEVLEAVDSTYSQLVDYQGQLEQRGLIEENLRAFIASVMQSVSDVLIVISREGEIEAASSSLADQTGLPIEDLRGRPLQTLFVDAASIGAAMETVRVERETVRLEAALERSDESIPLEVVFSPRLDERQRCTGFIFAGRPIGELRAAYTSLEKSHEALKQAQAQLVRNEKMASLGRLLAGVAHELNNPISFVYANAHALERYADKFEAYFERVAAGAERSELVRLRDELKLDRELRNLREAISGARDGAERVRDIVSDLRRLSADGKGEREAFDLVEIAQIGTDWVRRGSRRDHQILFEGAKQLIVSGHRGHVQQVVMNLVQNAVDAVADKPDGRITLTFGTKAGMAVFQVWDNGPGIAPEAVAQIFDPFFTTKPVGQGTGLGLAISHKIATEHGGNLRLYETDEGACFRLSLPLEGGE